LELNRTISKINQPELYGFKIDSKLGICMALKQELYGFNVGICMVLELIKNICVVLTEEFEGF